MRYSFFCHPCLAVMCGLIFVAVPAFAQMPPPMPRMITVTGEAKEQVAPDRATLTVSLVSKDMALDKAKSENDEMVEKLLSIAREFRIPKAKLSTSNLHIAPQYSYNKGERRFVGYQVSRTLQITMDDLSIHERVLSSVVDAKIDQINGVQFTLAEPETLLKTVRVKAVENAREKAALLASAAGAKLGKVLTITTAGVSAPAPMPYQRMAMAMQAEAADSSVAPSLPGLVTISESVTVSYALE